MSKADTLAKLVSTGGILVDGAITPAKISALHTDGGTMNGAITFANTQTWPTFNQSTTGNAATANKWTTARTLSLGGDATGNVSIDGSADATLTVAVADDSHNHTSSSGNFSVGGNLSVTGNLTINGTTTTVNSTVTTVDDPVITLGGDTAPSSDDSKDRGIEFRWHNGSAAKTGFFGFDDSTGYLTFIPDATNTSEVFSGTLGDIQATNFRGALFGNANTATTLATSRTINGVSFNGSADITVADSTKLPLAGGTMTGAITFAAGQTWPTFNQSTTGNAATATTLQTARTINGVSFNGSANVTIADSTKLPLAGGTMTGAISFAAGQTWPTFNQSTTGASARISVPDTRAVNDQPQNKTGYSITADFKENTAVSSPPITSSGLYSHIITVAGWDTSGGSGGWPSQLSVGDGIAVRQATNASTWGAWRNVLHSNNYGNYSTFNQVVVASQAGFQSATYSAGRNRIWSFANADAYGISYFQGGTDTIGFHFGTATLAGSVGRVTAAGLASFATLGLNNGFEIQQGGSNYGQFNTWVHLNGHYGLYAGTNSAHFYPNNGSYGSWKIDGSRNGWAGIEFGTGTSLMMNDDAYGFHRNTGGAWKFYVSGGNGYFPGNVTAYWSDARLKENLREIKHESLDILSAFTAYRFNWNAKVAEIGSTIPVGKEEIGLIAQQVQAALPDAVVVNKAGAKIGDSGFDYLTINYDRITPLLVEGVNIHTQEIKDLKSQVNELKELVQQLMKAQQ